MKEINYIEAFKELREALDWTLLMIDNSEYSKTQTFKMATEIQEKYEEVECG